MPSIELGLHMIVVELRHAHCTSLTARNFTTTSKQSIYMPFSSTLVAVRWP